MGCKQSKAGTAVVLNGDSNNKEKVNVKNNVKKSTPTNSIKGRRLSSLREQQQSLTFRQETLSASVSRSPKEKDDPRLYRLLVDTYHSLRNNNDNGSAMLDEKALKTIIDSITPLRASYVCPNSTSTSLQLAVQLLDCLIPSTVDGNNNNIHTLSTAYVQMVDELIRANPGSVLTEDDNNNFPLHYVVAPTTFSPTQHQTKPSSESSSPSIILWKTRTAILRLLLAADRSSKSIDYLNRNDVVYYTTLCQNDDTDTNNNGCSPLYRALQTIPDDFAQHSVTFDYLHFLLDFIASRSSSRSNNAEDKNRGTDVVCRGNASDGDKPLALLYRRFTRQFDLAEKFFSGDNSRPEVVEHRKNYKQAAGNTWKIIELLLQYQEQPFDVVEAQYYRTIHRAVQGETPPDLLRYIVETNAEDLTIPDESGNLPLHHAAKARPPTTIHHSTATDYKASFPSFYSKYVIDELLYKYPEAAGIPDPNGFFPLTLAVKSGKHWIGGGIKSLYDAYPEALEQINLEEHVALRRVLSIDPTNPLCENNDNADDEFSPTAKEEKTDDLIQDNIHDAIMLIQQENVDISEVVASMWAHEEDAGVQMLGCVAISRLISAATKKTMREAKENKTTSSKSNMDDVMRIALSAIPAVVNAMKAHPNEVIVQEKSCHALKWMAWSEGKREISFIASGAVAAIIGAMQAHVSDPGVQEEACGAVTRIIHYGGPDRATVVASVSGLTAIINALAAHPDVAFVQRDGCRALRELTEHPNANLPEIPRLQTEPLLEAAKRNFPAECGEIVDILLSRLS